MKKFLSLITATLFIAVSPLVQSGHFLGGQALAACSDDPEEGVNWEGCRKRNLVLSGTNLKNANLKETNLTSTDMRESEFDGADFRKSILLRVAFDGSSAKGAIFEKAIVYRSSFKNADLSNSLFRKSEMMRVNFNGANLTGVDFSKSEAGRSLFDGAKLGDNDFSFANLARADFRKAELNGPLDFEGAYFYLTRIEGVNLADATGLQQWQIDMACGDKDTVLPEGVTQPADWPCVGD